MSRLDSACDAIDLVAATVDTLAGIVENDIFGVEFVDRCASPLRIVFTEDVVKIAGQQGRYAVGHGCSFSPLDCGAACVNVSGGLNLTLFADVHRRLLMSQFLYK